jgi:MFS family permease
MSGQVKVQMQQQDGQEQAETHVRWRLAGMMALVYMVQGSWWPLVAVHLQDLGVSGRALGWIFATYSIAHVAAPLAAGQLADRLMPTQRLLALIYLIGTGLLAFAALGPTARPELLFVLFLVYWLLTAPTYALVNSLSFRNLPNPTQQFGSVRLCGTIGWMVVGWLVSALLTWRGSTRIGQGTYEAFWVAAACSGVFALYALRLPNTPPLATGHRRGIDLREAKELLRKPAVATFLVAAFCVSLSTPFVYQTVPAYLQTLGLPRPWISTAMTLGQVLEIASLAAFPWLVRRFGHRWTMAIGIGAWLLYYGILASHPPLVLALMALPFNGVAIACFIVAGQMFLDGHAPAQHRASAQGLHAMITSGLGAFLGSVLAGEVVALNGGVGPGVFLLPCLTNAAAFLILVRGFGRKRAFGAVAPDVPAPKTSRSAALSAPMKLSPGSSD